MKTLSVNEIFCSIQGEGARVGTTNIFIRLAGCNLDCDYCDTDFKHGTKMSLGEIQSIIQNYFPVKCIIWTGGEPLLQLNLEVIEYFKQFGYYQAVETNGTKKLPAKLDWITVSPKVEESVLVKNILLADEIRYPIKHGDPIPHPNVPAPYYYLSPIFSGNKLNRKNLNWCLKLIKENPKWRLSVQVHKLLKLK